MQAVRNPNSLIDGRYRILRQIGQGGMSMVYLVEDTKLDNLPCVAKELWEGNFPTDEQAEVVAGFRREAGLLARLQHPALVRVINAFTEGNYHYLIMDYIDGQNLEQIRDQRPITEKELIVWALEILDVLEYLHGQTPPVIYRDLKPSNVMLDKNGRIRLIDFGIARPNRTGSPNTRIGTPGYAPIEQELGQAEPRSDISALAVTLHNLLTKINPSGFDHKPVRSIRPDISVGLAQTIERACDPRVSMRFQTATEMEEAINGLGGTSQPSTTKRIATKTVVTPGVYAAKINKLITEIESLINQISADKSYINRARKCLAKINQFRQQGLSDEALQETVELLDIFKNQSSLCILRASLLATLTCYERGDIKSGIKLLLQHEPAKILQAVSSGDQERILVIELCAKGGAYLVIKEILQDWINDNPTNSDAYRILGELAGQIKKAEKAHGFREYWKGVWSDMWSTIPSFILICISAVFCLGFAFLTYTLITEPGGHSLFGSSSGYGKRNFARHYYFFATIFTTAMTCFFGACIAGYWKNWGGWVRPKSTSSIPDKIWFASLFCAGLCVVCILIIRYGLS